jgi:Fe-S cluster assembly iron-binding protein IscA
MFRITDRAAERLKTALSKADTGGAYLRIRVGDNKLQLIVDQERPGDMTIEHEGKTLAVLDPTAVNLLYNRELDFDKKSSGLVLKEAEQSA